MIDVSRETHHFSWDLVAAARKHARKVDPARFALLWLDGVPRAELCRLFGIRPCYASYLGRRLRLPMRKAGRPRKRAEAA